MKMTKNWQLEVKVEKIVPLFFNGKEILEVIVSDQEGKMVFWVYNAKVKFQGGSGYNEKWYTYKQPKARFNTMSKAAKQAAIDYRLDKIKRRDLE